MEPFRIKRIMLDCVSFSTKVSMSMKRILLVGLAIFAVSTSGALAAKKGAKPKAPAAAASANTGAAGSPMLGQVSAADRALYQKNQRESGMKK
ncbi:MAG: hypothetical protein H0V72_12850 [Bradyrhizobium sp.]|nr:hypothetical protein [Bradyrhizobium sp.]